MGAPALLVLSAAAALFAALAPSAPAQSPASSAPSPSAYYTLETEPLTQYQESLDVNGATILANHGITSAEYPAILGADPFNTCNSNVSCAQSIGVDLTRFTPTAAQTVQFESLGTWQEYQFSVTATSSQGQAGQYQYSLSYTLSATGDFEKIFNLGLKTQNTLTWTSKWSSTQSQTVGQTSTSYVQEPTSSQGYSGPVHFAVWQDTVYGTYMFFPLQD